MPNRNRSHFVSCLAFAEFATADRPIKLNTGSGKGGNGIPESAPQRKQRQRY